MSCNKFRRHRHILMWLPVLLLCLGCEHRPLLEAYWSDNLFVRVYFNEEIRNVSYGFYDESKKRPEYSSPEGIRVAMCDEVTGEVVAERYLHNCGEDENGYYIEGYLTVPNGKYNMLAYNFDTQITEVKHEGSYSQMAAYTRPLTESETSRFFSSRGDQAEDMPICKQPDHMFVTTVEGVEVNTPEYWEKPDTLKTEAGIYPVAETIVKTYYFQFNVKGVEHVRSAVALISGMAGSKTLHDGKMVEDDVASIYFSLNNGKDRNRATGEELETSVAYASFNTFGKLPHTEGYIDITFEFNTVYNTVQTETFRVTDMFESDEVKEKQWIIIDKVIEIIPPEGVDTGGGMAPGVNNWEEIEGSITI